jgi:toxin CptA
VQFPILIGLHRSRFLDIVVFVIAIVASAIVLAVPQPVISPWAFITTIWTIAAITWQELSPKLSVIRLERDGRLSVRRLGESDFLAAELLPGATVHPWLSVVKIKPATGNACIVIVAADSVNRQKFRRFRVFLRWQADFNAAHDDA